MIRGDKRGLSGVITTLILILLTLVAIGVIWVVVANLIGEGANTINTGQFTLDLVIDEVIVTDTGANVRVTRNSGDGDLTGLKFIISDGTNTEVVEVDADLKELETTTFPITYDGIVKSVSVAPIVGSNQGRTVTGDVKDSLQFSSTEAITNIPGIISWWRFEGNCEDEFGDNHGSWLGTEAYSGGILGSAAKFDGIGDYINYSNNSNLHLTGQEMSVVAWAKLVEDPNKGDVVWGEPIVSKASLTDEGYLLTMYEEPTNEDKIFFGINTSQDENGIKSNLDISQNTWYHLVGVKTSTDLILYIDGVQDNIVSYVGNIVPYNGDFLIGAAQMSGNPLFVFNGTIDEVMIFDRALSAEQVEDLYNLEIE